jgi:hypothetical protein
MTDTASPFRVQIFRKNLRPKSDRLLDIRSLLENRQFGPFWEQYRKPLPKAA